MTKSFKLLTFCFSKKSIFLFFIIFSIFHFGQSLSTDNSGVYIQKDTLITSNSELKDETVKADKESATKIIITGKEYLYIKKCTVVSGLKDIHEDQTIKKVNLSAPKNKAIAKRNIKNKANAKRNILPKKNTKENLSVSVHNIKTQPEPNSFYASSLSGQTVCIPRGSHYQNFIFCHTIRFISTVHHDKYSNLNYHYRYFVLSKNIIDGGGIRPPPFYC